MKTYCHETLLFPGKSWKIHHFVRGFSLQTERSESPWLVLWFPSHWKPSSKTLESSHWPIGNSAYLNKQNIIYIYIYPNLISHCLSIGHPIYFHVHLQYTFIRTKNGHISQTNLVCGWPTPLKNMKVSWEGLSHILRKITNVWNHQPVL